MHLCGTDPSNIPGGFIDSPQNSNPPLAWGKTIQHASVHGYGEGGPPDIKSGAVPPLSVSDSIRSGVTGMCMVMVLT